MAAENAAISKAEVSASKEMLTRLQSTRDAGTDAVRQDMQRHIEVLENELNTALNDASEAKSKRDLLQIKYDAIMRDCKAAGAQSTKLTTELTGLNKDLTEKERRINDLETVLRDVRVSEETFKRSASTLEQESSSLRSTIVSLQAQVDQLSRQKDMVPPAPVVVPPPVAQAPPPPSGAAVPGVLELGVLMGQQQATAAVLETRLKQADEMISKLHERSNNTTSQPQIPTVPRTSGEDRGDVPGGNVNDSDLEGYNKSELLREVLGTTSKIASRC